eukprot:Nk52_evm2s2506 gene=Nk52_evmTU2s2506
MLHLRRSSSSSSNQVKQKGENSNSGDIRMSPLKIQLLPESLRRQIFPEVFEEGYEEKRSSFRKINPRVNFRNETPQEIEKRNIDIAKKHLNQSGLLSTEPDILEPVDFQLPPLQGKDIREHFRALGEYAAEPYLSQVEAFVGKDTEGRLPRMPPRWELQPGWTRYRYVGRGGEVGDGMAQKKGEGAGVAGQALPSMDGWEVTKVEQPLEETLVFDVETCVIEGEYPTLACALSDAAWYCWVSPTLVNVRQSDGGAGVQEGEAVTRTDQVDVMAFPYTLGPKETLVPVNVEAATLNNAVKWALVEYLDMSDEERKKMLFIANMGPYTYESRAHENEAVVRELLGKQLRYVPDKKFVDACILMSEAVSVGTYENGDINVSKEEKNRLRNKYIDLAYQKYGFDVLDRLGTEELATYARLEESKSATVNDDHLIPLSSSDDKKYLIVGHNVSYDRARIREEYNLEKSNSRFLDTMSLHVVCAGMTSEQRMHYLSQSKKENDEGGQNQLLTDITSGSWREKTSMNSLKEVYSLHCGGTMDKEARDLFVTGTLQEIRDNFQELTTYCANDCLATYEVLCKLFPKYREQCPHPVSFAGMLEMGSMYLPIDEEWNKYIETCDRTYQESNSSFASKIAHLMDDAYERYRADPSIAETDPWFKHLEWKNENIGSKIQHDKFQGRWPSWYKEMFKEKMPQQKELLHCGYHPTCEKANTQKHLSEFIDAQPDVSTRKRCVPYLLRLSWDSHPIFYHFDEHNNDGKAEKILYGWGHLLPKEEMNEDDARDKELIKYDDDFVFKRLPHKAGPGNNVGNPLSKDFVSYIESGLLDSIYPVAKEGLLLNASGSYWSAVEARVKDQFCCWDNEVPLIYPRDELRGRVPQEMLDGKTFGAIIPKVIASGTVTRRAVEATWLTASNAKANRLGSELKAMVKAPPGFKLVGADVDSQELWISALIGDARFAGMHGCTAFGWMTLQGKKADKTDLHSNTASIIKISRDQAKVFNYGRIYGAGEKFAATLLLQFNKDLTEAEAKKKAKALYRNTKGEKMYVVKDEMLNQVRDCLIEARGNDDGIFKGCLLTPKEIGEISRAFYGHHQLDPAKSTRYYFKAIQLFTRQCLWKNGTESEMFNGLEEIANSEPKTPVLGCRITKALHPKYVEDRYLTSRINWVVQSSAVDYLHMILVSMKWMMNKYNIRGRFVISIHDEVRYLIHEDDVYRATLALHITNLWVRSMFAKSLNMDDLPYSVAFFSGVDIDKVLRKEVFMDCVTPSHPEPIPHGVALDIKETIKHTGGQLESNIGRQ